MTRSFGERRGTRVPSVFQSLQRAARRLTLRRLSTTEPSEKKQPDQAVASRDSVRPRSRLPFKLGLVTMVLSLCSGLATYVILSGLTPIVPTNLVVVVVLLINLVLVLAMLGIIAWQVTGLWLAKRKQVAGAQLHTRIVGLFKSQPQGFGNFLSAQAAIRALPMAYLIDGQGKVLATAASLPEFPYRAPPQEAMNIAKSGQAIVIAPGQTNMVGAIKSLQNFNDTYLYVIRPVNARVLQQLRATRASVAEYQLLEQRRAGVQVAFGLMYVAIALTLLLSAIWIGMWFANRLVEPIRELMGAAQEISEGNLDVAVNTKPADGDLAVLGATFNTMTSELKSQRDELVGANTALDERRRFMEAVLSGVTAGVVGVDSDGIITLVNRSAETLLGVKEASLGGKPLAKVVPEFGPVLKRAQKQGRRLVTDQIALRRAGSERNFAVRVTSEGTGQAAQGYVVTFDDMTELVSAQRSTAWADVARRIEHEIKNPLNPIQLSAERIRRKYG